VVVVSILLLKVVPTFQDMFAQFGNALPAPTQFVIDLSNWLQSNILFIAAGLAAVFFGVRNIYRTKAGRTAIDGFTLKLLVFGDLLTKVAVARFCRTLGTLIGSGVPILDGLTITVLGPMKAELQAE
jgi:type IV pilus assembly protein PilC